MQILITGRVFSLWRNVFCFACWGESKNDSSDTNIYWVFSWNSVLHRNEKAFTIMCVHFWFRVYGHSINRMVLSNLWLWIRLLWKQHLQIYVAFAWQILARKRNRRAFWNAEWIQLLAFFAEYEFFLFSLILPFWYFFIIQSIHKSLSTEWKQLDKLYYNWKNNKKNPLQHSEYWYQLKQIESYNHFVLFTHIKVELMSVVCMKNKEYILLTMLVNHNQQQPCW